MGPLLCTTVTAATTAELRERREAAEREGSDLVELRLDSVRDPNVAGALAGRKTPVLITCRPRHEGGSFRGSEEERRTILRDALAQGAEYVDLEASARFDDLVQQTRGRGVVLSLHDFNGVPDDLPGRLRAMRSTGAEIVKIAVTARRLADCIPLLEIGRHAGADAPAVLIAMGAPGLATRVLAAQFGSCWTYAGDAVAPGQIPPRRMLEDFGFRRISPRTSVYGIVGGPLTHTVSPAMHNAAFRAAKLDAVYLPLHASDANDFSEFAGALNVKGASVTTPFKVDVFARIDSADAVTHRVGAVNTVRITGGRWEGANTDVSGFLAPFGERYPLAGARASILGAGGAARAVAVALASVGARVTVHARRLDRARDVAVLVGGEAAPMPPAPRSWDLLVNATPCGMYPRIEETPLDRPVFDGRLVYDLVYNPPRTRLVAEADAAGCLTIGGLEMLVAQALQQFEWWTGCRVPEHVLRDAAVAALAEFQAELT